MELVSFCATPTVRCRVKNAIEFKLHAHAKWLANTGTMEIYDLVENLNPGIHCRMTFPVLSWALDIITE